MDTSGVLPRFRVLSLSTMRRHCRRSYREARPDHRRRMTGRYLELSTQKSGIRTNASYDRQQGYVEHILSIQITILEPRW
jgi:hypothetical protein